MDPTEQDMGAMLSKTDKPIGTVMNKTGESLDTMLSKTDEPIYGLLNKTDEQMATMSTRINDPLLNGDADHGSLCWAVLTSCASLVLKTRSLTIAANVTTMT
ncbi:hypothetical protein Bpfe_017211 [Biomphalaria pfeifferi]|uniref:Uncharacterized protein n=1 Tax=Biomphalaria pfeifferi TaxID=112525 RepID=A0AAD8BGZ5_BIOPF|nr:hypothetical protein Bpfe_017211 [Biomphalaria pfeifferi]